MRRIVSFTAVTLLSLGTLAVAPSTARSLGVFEDVAGEAGLLYGRHQTTLAATATRTGGHGRDASVFTVSAGFPVRRNVFVQVEQSFIALVGESSDFASGFGDAVARARVNLATGDGRAFRLLGSLRLGTGNANLFPYSSQTTDVQLGVGYVDSLDVLHVWTKAEGGVVKRVPETLDQHGRHEDFVRLGAGVALELGDQIDLRGGASTLWFRSGGDRQIYFAQVGFSHSPAIEAYASTLFEAGARAERASDFAVAVGIRTTF